MSELNPIIILFAPEVGLKIQMNQTPFITEIDGQMEMQRVIASNGCLIQSWDGQSGALSLLAQIFPHLPEEAILECANEEPSRRYVFPQMVLEKLRKKMQEVAVGNQGGKRLPPARRGARRCRKAVKATVS